MIKMYLKFAIFFLLIVKTYSFYSGSSTVIDLNTSNFNKLVKNAKEIWLVEFYAPWCGHCQNFASEYEKAAKVLDGIIKVGAVNVVENPSLGTEYAVQGYPTVKIINAEKGTMKDYQGERMAKALVSYIINIIQNKINARLNGNFGPAVFKSKNVKELTDRNFDELVLASKEAWLVVFYSPSCDYCKQLASKWKKVTTALKGNIKLGAIDGTFHTKKTSEFKVSRYPTVLFYPSGIDKITSVIEYSGKPDAADVSDWAMEQLAENAPPPEVIEIVNFKSLVSACDKKPLCVISILPHILDCQASCRDEYLDMLKNVSLIYKKWLWGWVWSEANAQPYLQEALQLGGGGFPTMAAVNVNKRKYSVLVGSFSFNGINAFLRDLLYGRRDSKPITLKEVPDILEIEPWNGKDAEESTTNAAYDDELVKRFSEDFSSDDDDAIKDEL